MSDFSRFRMDVDVLCYCGHKATLPHGPVVRLFVAKCWPKDLHSALSRFRCTKCGSAARHLGPVHR